MVIESILTALLVPDYSADEALSGPDYPLTYLGGHPSFPTIAMQVTGPYRLVVAKDRLQYTGKRRGKVIFQLPYELLASIDGRQGQLRIRLTDGRDHVEIEFIATGRTKNRDAHRLIRQVGRRAGSWRNARATA